MMHLSLFLEPFSYFLDKLFLQLFSSYSPLHYACAKGRFDTALFITRTGEGDVKGKAKFGQTPLHLLASHQNELELKEEPKKKRIVGQLLNQLVIRGCDLNAKNDDGMAPLQVAVISKSNFFVSLLLQYGSGLLRSPHPSLSSFPEELLPQERQQSEGHLKKSKKTKKIEPTKDGPSWEEKVAAEEAELEKCFAKTIGDDVILLDGLEMVTETKTVETFRAMLLFSTEKRLRELCVGDCWRLILDEEVDGTWPGEKPGEMGNRDSAKADEYLRPLQIMQGLKERAQMKEKRGASPSPSLVVPKPVGAPQKECSPADISDIEPAKSESQSSDEDEPYEEMCYGMSDTDAKAGGPAKKAGEARGGGGDQVIECYGIHDSEGEEDVEVMCYAMEGLVEPPQKSKRKKLPKAKGPILLKPLPTEKRKNSVEPEPEDDVECYGADDSGGEGDVEEMCYGMDNEEDPSKKSGSQTQKDHPEQPPSAKQEGGSEGSEDDVECYGANDSGEEENAEEMCYGMDNEEDPSKKSESKADRNGEAVAPKPSSSLPAEKGKDEQEGSEDDVKCYGANGSGSERNVEEMCYGMESNEQPPQRKESKGSDEQPPPQRKASKGNDEQPPQRKGSKAGKGAVGEASVKLPKKPSFQDAPVHLTLEAPGDRRGRSAHVFGIAPRLSPREEAVSVEPPPPAEKGKKGKKDKKTKKGHVAGLEREGLVTFSGNSDRDNRNQSPLPLTRSTNTTHPAILKQTLTPKTDRVKRIKSASRIKKLALNSRSATIPSPPPSPTPPLPSHLCLQPHS